MFTHAWLLWFLPLALVPIVLHWMSRWRLREVELSTFRFLLDTSPVRRRSRWIERLVLLLRIVFLALLVITISRPMTTSFRGLLSGDAGRDVFVIIDTSTSMNLPTAGQTALERGKAAAKTIMEMLGPLDHLTLIEAGGSPRLAKAGYVDDGAAFTDQLDPFAASAEQCDLAAAFALINQQDLRGPRLVVVISDNRTETFKTLADHPSLTQMTEQTSMVVLDVGATQAGTNVGIIGEKPAVPHATVGLPMPVKVVLTCSSTQAETSGPPQSRVLRVLLDDRVVEQMTIEISPGQVLEKSIAVTPTTAGLLRGRFELSADGFAEDDSFLFALNVAEKLNVLVVTGPVAAIPAERPLLFLEAALTNASRESSDLAGNHFASASAVAVSSIAHDELTEAQLITADVVILADAPIDPIRAAMLRRYVDSGGGLLVMPGPHMLIDVINTHLLHTLRYDNPLGDPDDETTFRTIGSVQLNHPILSTFTPAPDLSKSSSYFDTLRLYRFHPIQQIDSATPLLALTDGTPVLVEAKVGRGRLMLASFAATPGWSNLPVSGKVFVPLLIRSVEHLRRASPVQLAVSGEPGGRAMVTVTDAWHQAGVQVMEATGRTHLLAMHRQDRQRVGVFEPTQRKGFYAVEILPGGPSDAKAMAVGFAVNLDPRVSQMSRIDEPELRKLFSPRPVTTLQSTADDPQLAAALTHRGEIWGTLIWLLLAIMGVEFWLSSGRIKSEKAGKPESQK